MEKVQLWLKHLLKKYTVHECEPAAHLQANYKLQVREKSIIAGKKRKKK